MTDSAAMTLYELNSMVRSLIDGAFHEACRVKAELSEVRVSPKGHCFIELIQKGRGSSVPVAKARGVIMADVFPLLKLDFEETTGQLFGPGIEVLLEVRPTFSEIYGYSLIVVDIDPTYTLGDMARQRREIMLRLEKEGVAALQKGLSLPLLPQRIAVISSPTAAGYGDFCHQIDENRYGYRFCYKLFPALMQGSETEKSIIAALDKIAAESNNWDVVVIIRGGGAVSDLSGFETYELANHCAQFPLPVITGIGHLRDQTVLDMVAYEHMKTPTAVGDFLISRMSIAAAMLDNAEKNLHDALAEVLQHERKRLDNMAMRLEWFFKNFRQSREQSLNSLLADVHRRVLNAMAMQKLKTEHLADIIVAGIVGNIERQRQHMELLQQKISMHDPQRILKMGYSMTMKDGQLVTTVTGIRRGDKLVTRLADGEVNSIAQ